ncbi:MAG: hypothetical protein NXI32_25405 [bacterium]|nr:hypothetical protein [bacterium]
MRVSVVSPAIALLVFTCSLAQAAIVTKESSNSGGIHTDGDRGDGQYSEFYASGNDDAFAEFGVLGFTFTPADFGLAVLTEADIQSIQLSLTVNDRGFSDGNAIELFFTPDTFASLGNGTGYTNLTYDATLTNGINTSQFTTTPISLGVYAIPEMAGRPGGEVDVIDVNFSGAALTSLVNSINAGTDFQILAGATDASHDLTYSGFGNTFDPGNPTLSINAVPEPGGLMLLTMLGTVALRTRSRRR